MKTLSFFCYANYSDLLKALNSVSNAAYVVETGATHRGHFVLLCKGEATPDLKNGSVDSCTIQNVHADLVASYFKQRQVRVEKDLICVESEKLSSVFEAAQNILESSDFQCIEINRALSETGKANALFANGSSFSVFQKLKDVQVTMVKSPGPAIKKYF